MDPNAALMNIRAALSVMKTTEDFEAWTTAAADLQEHVGALDDWLSLGGFPPEDWTTQTPTEGELST